MLRLRLVTCLACERGGGGGGAGRAASHGGASCEGPLGAATPPQLVPRDGPEGAEAAEGRKRQPLEQHTMLAHKPPPTSDFRAARRGSASQARGRGFFSEAAAMPRAHGRAARTAVGPTRRRCCWGSFGTAGRGHILKAGILLAAFAFAEQRFADAWRGPRTLAAGPPAPSLWAPAGAAPWAAVGLQRPALAQTPGGGCLAGGPNEIGVVDGGRRRAPRTEITSHRPNYCKPYNRGSRPHRSAWAAPSCCTTGPTVRTALSAGGLERRRRGMCTPTTTCSVGHATIPMGVERSHTHQTPSDLLVRSWCAPTSRVIVAHSERIAWTRGCHASFHAHGRRQAVWTGSFG